MKLKRTLFLFVLPFIFSSCAAIFHGGHQKVMVISDPPGARIFVNEVDTEKETPSHVWVKRKQPSGRLNQLNELVYHLKKDGYQVGEFVDPSTTNFIILLDYYMFVVPGLIGTSMGAHINYSDKVHVELRRSHDPAIDRDLAAPVAEERGGQSEPGQQRETTSPDRSATIPGRQDIPATPSPEGSFDKTSTLPSMPDDLVPRFDRNNPFGTQRATLNAENPTFSHRGVSFSLSPIFLEKDVQLTVRPFEVTGPLGSVKAHAFDFKLDPPNQNVGVMEIRIPFDNPGNSMMAGAGYFNESTGKWEPVAHWVDYENNEVVILTDHLSTFGNFVENKGNRMATLKYFYSPSLPQGNDFEKGYNDLIAQSVSDGFSSGNKAADFGFSVLSSWMDFSGLGLTIESLTYGSDFLSDFSDALTNLGYGVSFMQIMYDYQRGETRKAGATALTTAQNFAVSKIGTTALKVGLIGVFFIKYSLDSFVNAAITGTEEFYQKAYRIYYDTKRTPVIGKTKTHQQWYETILAIYENAKTPEEADKAIMHELDVYVNHFWNDDQGGRQIALEAAVSEDRRGRNVIRDEAGYNEAMIKKFNENHKAELLRESLLPVFDQIEKHFRLQKYDDYHLTISELRNHLDQSIFVTIREEEVNGQLHFPGAYVRLAPLLENANVDDWTGQMRENGQVRTRFTVVGHLMAGAPSKVQIFKDKESLENNTPTMEVPMELNMPRTEVVFSYDKAFISVSPDAVSLTNDREETVFDVAISNLSDNISNIIIEYNYGGGKPGSTGKTNNIPVSRSGQVAWQLSYRYGEINEETEAVFVVRNAGNNEILGQASAKISTYNVRITSDRSIDLQISEGSVKEYTQVFTAIADPPGMYEYRWNFDDGNTFTDRKGSGQTSSVTHTYTNLKEGQIFRPSVELLKDGKPVSRDQVLIGVEEAQEVEVVADSEFQELIDYLVQNIFIAHYPDQTMEFTQNGWVWTEAPGTQYQRVYSGTYSFENYQWEGYSEVRTRIVFRYGGFRFYGELGTNISLDYKGGFTLNTPWDTLDSDIWRQDEISFSSGGN